MGIQIIDKNGNAENVISGAIINNTKDSLHILILDDTKEIDDILEKAYLTVFYGENLEHEVKTIDHYIESSTKNGGSNSALESGQIIVRFVKKLKWNV